MRCLELFAGAGGAALGLASAGLEHAALVEWDRHACATLRAAGLGPVVEGDVRALDAIAAVAGESVDVLWSSFPCQAWSTLGARKGARDDRNGWPWTVDAVDRFRPAWFLGENVRGLLLHRGGCSRPADNCSGCYFERVILPDLRARFAHVGWWLLDAADYGVPQHRRRVILWAGPGPLVEPVPTHGPGRALPWITMQEGLRLGEGWVEWEPMKSMSSPGWVKTEDVPVLGPAPTVTSQLAKQARPWLSASLPYLAQRVDVQEGEKRRRRLTIAECSLLQGFSESYPWQGAITAQYQQVGNAVPPRLAEVVGRALIAAANVTSAQAARSAGRAGEESR